MSIKDLTITDQNVQSTYVQSQPDRLTGTAQQNKAVFDALPQLIIQRFNLLLEALAGTGAAGEIPVGPIEGVTAENVQQALEAIQQNLTAYINKIKAATGAAEVGVSSIGGMTAQNVQKALEELRTAIDNIVSGIIPGGSITANMLGPDVTGEKIPVTELDKTPISMVLSTKANGYLGSAESLKYSAISEINTQGTYYFYDGPKVFSDYPEELSKDLLNYGLLNVNVAIEYTTYEIIALSPDGLKIGKAFAHKTLTGLKWEREATTASPKVWPMTLQSGFTENGGCDVFKTQESVVYLLGGVSGTLLANQDTQIGTMNAGYYPSRLCRRAATTETGPAYVEIREDGTVWIHPFSPASSCWFDATYVANEEG